MVADHQGRQNQGGVKSCRTCWNTSRPWQRVVKINVYLSRATDFDDMNRIYTTYFADGRFPARTTIVVHALPKPEFLLEIECEAILF